MGLSYDIILHLKTHILGRKVKMGSHENEIYYVHSTTGHESPEGK
jgi:hypothetical protein